MYAPLLIDVAEGCRRGLLPPPFLRISISVPVALTIEEMTIIKNGVAPASSDDKWLTFTDGEWSYIYKTWSGICAYGIKFSADASITDAWFNGDEGEWIRCGLRLDRPLVAYKASMEESLPPLLRLFIEHARHPDFGGPCGGRSIYAGGVLNLRTRS